MNTIFWIGAIVLVVWIVYEVGKKSGEAFEQDRPHRERWGISSEEYESYTKHWNGVDDSEMRQLEARAKRRGWKKVLAAIRKYKTERGQW